MAKIQVVGISDELPREVRMTQLTKKEYRALWGLLYKLGGPMGMMTTETQEIISSQLLEDKLRVLAGEDE